jgi:hypothetical protein
VRKLLTNVKLFADDELMRSLCGVDIENEITAGIVDGIVQLDREFQSDAHMFFRLTAAVRCEQHATFRRLPVGVGIDSSEFEQRLLLGDALMQKFRSQTIRWQLKQEHRMYISPNRLPHIKHVPTLAKKRSDTFLYKSALHFS